MNITKIHIIIGILVVLFLIILRLFLPQEETFITEINDSQTEEKTIFVHIDGAVQNPGIKEVKEGTRIFELIELSGGETENADISRLNLASVLKDEQKVIVPYKITEEDQTINTFSTNYQLKQNSNTKIININYASLQELQALSGIGVSMAQKIISYRDENGLFNSIEEIKNVSGIGEAKFEKIKDNITI